MSLPTIEIYSDVHCPWAYLATYRLRTVWPHYAGRVRLVWRALSLEYINERGTPKPVLDAEISLMPRIEPDLPIKHWRRPDWQWPITFWPALEALACAQAQGDGSSFAMSWALRRAFFVGGRCLSLRHELFAVARDVAGEGHLDLDRFSDDWDHGRYKATVLAESRRGWHELKVKGSPTFVLPDGSRLSNLAAGVADIDDEHGAMRGYTPYDGDPLAAYCAMLDATASRE